MARFADYVDQLRKAGAKVADRLNPGADDDEFRALAAFPEVSPPEQMLDFWRCHNGSAEIGITLGQVWVDGTFRYLSLAEAAEDYRITLDLHDRGSEGIQTYWPLGFFPIGTPGDGSRLMVNCIAGSPTHGAVYELCHGLGLSRMSDDLARYFDTLCAFLAQGALSVDGRGELEIDFDKAQEIGERMNPGCDFWDATLPNASERPDWVA